MEEPQMGCSFEVDDNTFIVQIYADRKISIFRDLEEEGPFAFLGDDKYDRWNVVSDIKNPRKILHFTANAVINLMTRYKLFHLWFQSIDCPKRAKVYERIFTSAAKSRSMKFSFYHYRGYYEIYRVHKLENS